MTRFAQLVMGPAGAGKSSYCSLLNAHFEASLKKKVHMVNLDPAAENFDFPVSVDIRDLVSLEDVVEELGLGPNGGLVAAMEFLVEHDGLEWLEEQLSGFADDSYLIFDCPGQIELYSHVPVMRRFVDALHKLDFRVCGVYLLDSLFISDSAKFVAGSLSALSAMLSLEIPHVNVLSKCDLVGDKEKIKKFLDCDTSDLADDLARSMPRTERFNGLHIALCSLLEQYALVSFVALDPNEEESIEEVLNMINSAIQWGEEIEPRDQDYDEADRMTRGEGSTEEGGMDGMGGLETIAEEGGWMD